MISPSSLAHPADPEKKWRGGREDRKNEGGREKKRENTRNAFDWSVFSPLNTLFFFFFSKHLGDFLTASQVAQLGRNWVPFQEL